MQTFKAIHVAMLLRELKEQQANCRSVKLGGAGGGTQVPPTELELVRKVFQNARGIADECDFSAVRSTAIFAIAHYQKHQGIDAEFDVSTLAADLRHLEDSLLNDISKQAFLRVSQARRGLIDNDKILGDAVQSAFPSAVPDLREAGNCLAADCNTAAVFHLMRAVEWGLRALAVDLGLQRLRTKNKKTGKVSYAHLAYSDWEHILNQLQSKVELRLARTKRGPKKQLYQEFYYPAIQDIKAIRDAWRNHVMHTRREYKGPDADAILDHVRRLLTSLATRVSEV